MNTETKWLLRGIAWTLAVPQVVAAVLAAAATLFGWLATVVMVAVSSVAFATALYFAPRIRPRIFKEFR